MVKCVHCGTENDPVETAGYCDDCGKKLPRSYTPPGTAFPRKEECGTGVSSFCRSPERKNELTPICPKEKAPPASAAASHGDRLRAVLRGTPVTWTLVAANVALFAAMAMSWQRVMHFNSHVVLTWGGGLAPRVFGGQWWRAGSYMFVHGDLGHLSTNLLFLLLIAPLLERLLGSVRFTFVYLFAGLGGGLLAMGAAPLHVVVGSSAAVYGLYGALLGCCLRGPRSVPWRIVAQRGVWLLLYTLVSLLVDWLKPERDPAGHLGGFVFGVVGGLLCGHQLQRHAMPAFVHLGLLVVGGLLCGHQLQPRGERWRLLRLAAVPTAFGVVIGLTAWRVHVCVARALIYHAKYATFKDRERELLGRFDDSLRQWEHGKLTGAAWKERLETELIPAWQAIRSSCGLQFTGKLAELEQQRFTMDDLWRELGSMSGEPNADDEKPLTVEEYGKMVSLFSKIRLDTWRELANELPGNRAMMVRVLLDHHELQALSLAFEEVGNAHNPLHQWFGPSRGSRRPVEMEEVEPDPGLIKNRGFENKLEGWTPFSTGPPPQMEFDTTVKRQGRQSLRMIAERPSESGCFQNIKLEAGHWYRFTGWVRTDQCVPLGSRNYCTFVVYQGGGNSVIKAGPNHRGSSRWTKVTIEFQAPPGGWIRIYAAFFMSGPGVGAAWFDDLKLSELKQPPGQR